MNERTEDRELVERVVDLPARGDEVWNALTDPAALSEWFGADVEARPPAGFGRPADVAPGSRLVFRGRDGSEDQAVVEEAVEGRRLAFRWLRTEDPGGSRRGTVSFDLEPIPGGTRLRVVETAARAGLHLQSSSAPRARRTRPTRELVLSGAR